MQRRLSRRGTGFRAAALISFALVPVTVTFVRVANAQPAPVLQPVPGQPAPLQPAAVQPLPTAPAQKPPTPGSPPMVAPGTTNPMAPFTMPAAPNIDDPMLVPAPPAARVVGTWADAIQLVRARSTDLGTAYAEVRRAEAASRTALAGVLPSGNASASIPHQFITRTGTDGSGRTVETPQGDYVNFGVSLQQSVINLQTWHSIGTAKQNEKVAALSAEDTNRNITLAVASAIVAVVAAERVAELNRNGLRSALERRDLTSRKRGLGVATGLDVVRADQDVSSSRATLVNGDESLRKAREALGLALGIPDQVGVPASLKLDDIVQSAQQTCPGIGTLAERPDIAALHKRIEIADRNVHNVELGFLPTINASSNISTSTNDNGGLPVTWSITGTLSVPIWDGGARYGALRSNRALRDEAGFSLEAATRNATVQVQQARRAITVAEAARDVAQQTRDLAQQVDQLTQTGYRAGQGTSLELVTAASALRQAEISLALREFDVVSAKLEALFAMARCNGSP